MPLSTTLVGTKTSPKLHTVDARSVMAYAAGLSDFNPLYMDTSAHAVIAHPLFPVCLEWPVILDTRNLAQNQTLTPQETRRGVHAVHDLHIFQPIRAGDTLTTTATVIGVRAIKPGAAYTLELDTRNAATGKLVARTYQLSIYRDVQVSGNTASQTPTPKPPPGDLQGLTDRFNLEVAQGAAHIYSECAQIWNPIHTDRATALAAGLPDIILHGTATMAMAVSQLINHYAHGDPQCITRIGGRFSAMVLMPSTITVEAKKTGNTVYFQVSNAKGELALSHGFICLT